MGRAESIELDSCLFFDALASLSECLSWDAGLSRALSSPDA